MKALSLFERVVKCMKELEDRYTIILKLEMFSDISGDCWFTPNTGKPWIYAFPFIDLDSLEHELTDFEQYIAG